MDRWLQALIVEAQQSPSIPFHPSLISFEKLIAEIPALDRLCQSMFIEARLPISHPHQQITELHFLLQLFNIIQKRAPEWEDVDSPEALLGLPFNRILLVLMATPSGHKFFARPDVNQQMKAILKEWTTFLESSRSRYVLNSADGWLSPGALSKLESMANSPKGSPPQSFTTLFECPDEEDRETYGFASWDEFFSRRFRPGIRPLPSPIDLEQGEGAPVVSACESRPWALVQDCPQSDSVKLKGRSYSIFDMLDQDPLAHHFDHGTVYQAYLSALSYHRWHAPVSGTIVRVRQIDGSYFSSMPMDTPLAMEYSQDYLAGTAARALVFIEASDPRIGLLCFIAVGMGEVSSCSIARKEGDQVQAGDELGSFHYGGSTHCLLFNNRVEVKFDPEVEECLGGVSGRNVAVNSLLCWCQPKTKYLCNTCEEP